MASLLALPVAAQEAPQNDEASSAQAHEAEQEKSMSALDQEARQHFMLGKTFYDSGRFQQAAEEFGEAYRLSQRPQLLYNLYVAHRDAGHLKEAVDALSAYLEKVPDAPDVINLRARLESLNAQLQRQQEQEAAAQRAREQEERERNTPKTRLEVQRSVVPWVLMGTGGALLVGSAVTGILTKGKIDDLDKACSDKRCPSSEQDNVDSAKTLALTTDILWGTGALTAVAGAVLWWTGALDTEREVPVAGVSITPHGVSTTLTGRF